MHARDREGGARVQYPFPELGEEGKAGNWYITPGTASMTNLLDVWRSY